jgi:hypothetical protein
MRTSRAALVLLILLVAPAAWAQSAPPRAETVEYVRLVNDPRVLDAAMGRIVTLVAAAIKSEMQGQLARSLSSREEETLAATVRRVMQSIMSADVLERMFAETIERHFTADEIRALIAFRRTPLGEKFSRLTYTISEEMAQATERLFQARQHDLPRMFEEEMRKTPLR